jgi:hypothetical protein
MLEISQVTQDVASATGRLFELWVLVLVVTMIQLVASRTISS